MVWKYANVLGRLSIEWDEAIERMMRYEVEEGVALTG